MTHNQTKYSPSIDTKNPTQDDDLNTLSPSRNDTLANGATHAAQTRRVRAVPADQPPQKQEQIRLVIN